MLQANATAPHRQRSVVNVTRADRIDGLHCGRRQQRGAFAIDDDTALIWLQDQSQTDAVAAYLNANAPALFIDEVLAGNEMTLKFNQGSREKTASMLGISVATLYRKLDLKHHREYRE